MVAQARALRPRIAALRQEEAAARQQLQEAERLTIEEVQLLHAAFTHQPDPPEAHQALVEHYRARHEEAERTGQLSAAALEQQLRRHDRTDAHTAYLSGEVFISLDTEPPNAVVTLHRGEEVDRRIVYRLERTVRAPVVDLRLPHVRWLIEVSASNHHTARIPLWLERAGRWESRSRVRLPGSVGEADCLISAGAFTCGGDPDAYSALPQRRVWLPDFVMKKRPVTNREFIAFLDDLVTMGAEEDSLRWVLRERAGQRGEPGALLYGCRPDGGFTLQEDADGHLWLPGWPVLCVDWHGTQAYADWLAKRTALPWRLPSELEWEKAAGRGDGRQFPWGDHLDPTWCGVRRSRRPG
ncbi:MAG: hypothetical protein ACI8RZ_007489 [Myxococcota bacterium]